MALQQHFGDAGRCSEVAVDLEVRTNGRLPVRSMGWSRTSHARTR